MKNNQYFLLKFMIFLIMIGLPTVFQQPVSAKGGFSKITIIGGHIKSAINITDPTLLDFFSFSFFPDSRTTEPKLNEGFLITRYYQQQDGSFMPVDNLYYYPNAIGIGGYVFYDGLINGSSEYDGKWYIASTEGDLALREILTSTKISQEMHVRSNHFIMVLR